MKDDQLYVLDGDDKRELDELRRKVRSLVITREGPTRPVRPVEDTSAWHTWVRLYSGTAVGGFYPGTLATYDTITKAFEDNAPADTVWVKQSEGKTLREGVYYWCRLEGNLTNSGDMRPLYLIGPTDITTVHAARMSLLQASDTGTQAVAVSSTAGGGSLVAFDTLEYDTDGFYHSNTTFGVPNGLEGLYHLTGNVRLRNEGATATNVTIRLMWRNALDTQDLARVTVSLPSGSGAQGLDILGACVSADAAMNGGGVAVDQVWLVAGYDDAAGPLVTGANLSLHRIGPVPAILDTNIGGGSGSGSGSGGGTGTSCSCDGLCGDPGVPSTLAATFTSKVGAWAAMPDSATLSCSENGLGGHIWLAGGSLATVFGEPQLSEVGCGASFGNTGVPHWGWTGTSGSGHSVACDAGNTCLPFSAVFHVDDGAGNTMTVTVVG